MQAGETDVQDDARCLKTALAGGQVRILPNQATAPWPFSHKRAKRFIKASYRSEDFMLARAQAQAFYPGFQTKRVLVVRCAK